VFHLLSINGTTGCRSERSLVNTCPRWHLVISADEYFGSDAPARSKTASREWFHAVNSWPVFWHTYSVSLVLYFFFFLSPSHTHSLPPAHTLSQLPAELTGCVRWGIRLVCVCHANYSHNFHQQLTVDSSPVCHWKLRRQSILGFFFYAHVRINLRRNEAGFICSLDDVNGCLERAVALVFFRNI